MKNIKIALATTILILFFIVLLFGGFWWFIACIATYDFLSKIFFPNFFKDERYG